MCVYMIRCVCDVRHIGVRVVTRKNGIRTQQVLSTLPVLSASSLDAEVLGEVFDWCGMLSCGITR
jgi:hypothetical protein